MGWGREGAGKDMFGEHSIGLALPCVRNQSSGRTMGV